MKTFPFSLIKTAKIKLLRVIPSLLLLLTSCERSDSDLMGFQNENAPLKFCYELDDNKYFLFYESGVVEFHDITGDVIGIQNLKGLPRSGTWSRKEKLMTIKFSNPDMSYNTGAYLERSDEKIKLKFPIGDPDNFEFKVWIRK